MEPVQEGARWLYARPSGQEVAAWFIANVKVHAGMDPDDWANGLTVIEQTEKHKVTKDDGEVVDRQRLVYAPFVKAEARVLYFRQWLAKNPDLVGVIDRSRVPRITDGSLRDNSHLPDGYFLHAVVDAQSQWKTFVGSSVEISVYERDLRSGGRGRLVMQAPGDKLVEQTNRWGPDVNAVMAAQTGAVARALGLLGMLVIAGSSVATAEDVEEALAAGGPDAPAPTATTVALPEGVPSRGEHKPATEDKPADQRAYILAMLSQLKEHHPDRYEEVQAWARERKLDWEDLEEKTLRGIVRQLERRLAE